MNLRTLVHGLLSASLALTVLLAPSDVMGRTKEKGKDQGAQKDDGGTIQRVPTRPFEIVRNNVSNLDLVTSNYGIFGFNVLRQQPGGIWPRGSGRSYVFGGGIWFGAKKFVNDTIRKMSVIGYNPNSGGSWMVPGRTSEPLDKSVTDESLEGINNFRVYQSTEYNSFTGEPNDAVDKGRGGPNWPIWDTNPSDTLKVDRYFGFYINDVKERNRRTYPKGPAIISQEDIFSTYKDTDLSRYEIGRGRALREGYPLGLQIEQTIYSWGFGLYKDFMFLKYQIINVSQDTLYDCVMAPAMDMDIGSTLSPAGAGNDRVKIAIKDKAQDTLGLGVQWSEDEARPLGYLGMDFLESPAVDANGFLRRDKRFYNLDEQIGLRAFRNWIIQIDPSTPEERYDFMFDPARDEDNGPGDKRFLMSCGTFNMRPGDTARVVVGILMAYGYDPNNPGRAEVQANGQWENMKRLIDLDTFAQSVYNNNFRSPIPPDAAQASWRPLNEGVELHWDETSERSIDLLERGLDFAGYNIQRTRKGAANFTPIDSIQGWDLGWKTVGMFQIPRIPDSLVRVVAARNNDARILGAWWRLPMLMDTIPGQPAVTGTIIFRVDTLRRPGLPDSLRQTNIPFDTVSTFHVTFDPFDDRNNDSTAFNNTPYGNTNVYGERYRNKATRDLVRQAITEIMDSVTNHRTFIDVGDLDGDGVISENRSDLSQNERLLNNVDYYYRVLAFDQGDTAQGTPPKTNTGQPGVNEIVATPEAPAAGPSPTPTIIESDGLGGIRNVRAIVYDQLRLGQLFGGDTIEFYFEPFQTSTYYITQVIARSRRTNSELGRFLVTYNFDFADRADINIRNLDTTFVTRLDIDTAADPDDTTYYDARLVRAAQNNTFTTQPIYGNTVGLAFDYSFVQFGDSLRFGRYDDTLTPGYRAVTVTATGGANTNVIGAAQSYGSTPRARLNGQGLEAPYRTIPSVGQPRVEVEFLPGGTETIVYENKSRTITLRDVPYLTVKVRNIASYERDVINPDGSTSKGTIQYNYEYPADPAAKLNADTTTLTPLAEITALGQHALYAYVWQNADTLSADSRRKPLTRTRYNRSGNAAKYYVGTPGRYYVGRHTGTDDNGATQTVTFTHKLIVNGAEIAIDFAGMGNPETAIKILQAVPDTPPTVDFQAGDKFVVDFTGGALGLPQPNAKVVIAIPETKPALADYNDDLLEQVNVVPNPYMVTHLGQQSNTDRQIYFTRLPEECKIEIYTSIGELLQTIEHKAPTPGGRIAVNAWDLLTKADRQTQSQLLVARITTPNGAETIKKFAIVVGGFRIVAQ